MYKPPKIRITAGSPQDAKVTIDGYEIPALRSVYVEQTLDGIARVTIEMISDDIAVEGEAACDFTISNPRIELADEAVLVDRATEAVLERFCTKVTRQAQIARRGKYYR